jgi:hypothetical protein
MGIINGIYFLQTFTLKSISNLQVFMMMTLVFSIQKFDMQSTVYNFYLFEFLEFKINKNLIKLSVSNYEQLMQ